MAELRLCKSLDDVNEMIAESNDKVVLLFKHSTTCPISAVANNEVAAFASRNDNVSVWKVQVLENRPVSIHIADITGITHQSPQVILFKNGKAVWDASHYRINNAGMQKAVEDNTDK